MSVPGWVLLAALLWSARWLYLNMIPPAASLLLLATLGDDHAYLKKKERLENWLWGDPSCVRMARSLALIAARGNLKRHIRAVLVWMLREPDRST